MRHVAIMYTDNSTTVQISQKVLDHFCEMIYHSDLLFETRGIVVSKNSVADVIDLGDMIKNIIAPITYLNQGVLSIIKKISLAMDLLPSDVISLHEHDVLYPSDYLVTVQTVFSNMGNQFDYLAYNNLLGVNLTGYQQRIVQDHPFSTLTFHTPILHQLLTHKRNEFESSDNFWCYLEPGYAGSFGSHFRGAQLETGVVSPAIHINMNKTTKNHHLTDHYLTYEPISRQGFNEWPGDISNIFDFD